MDITEPVIFGLVAAILTACLGALLRFAPEHLADAIHGGLSVDVGVLVAWGYANNSRGP